ncbi:hypothetical protein HU200_031644 [Digitaria exilis]|uniref:HTH myb-type domain-containing protein n=1 Tax=Digitaria exilis TaxID=1010633 RepID=A0A835ER85_9POAL|nr:hypothetical protein HU200_031644 [Digitaria exilis]
MASSSSTFSTAIAHGQFSNLTPSILHSFNAEIMSPDSISYTRVSEQSLQANYSGLPAEARLGSGAQHNNGIHSMEGQHYPGSDRTLDESDDREWLRCLANGSMDGIITTNITSEYPQMAESAPINSEMWQQERMIHQSVTFPSNLQQVYPTVSPLATANANSPKRTKARMRWTTEMHDRFIDAVNQLGGNAGAKPKDILGIMDVEGLTRDQVKSHLQKYKSAQVKHRSSEGQLMVVGNIASHLFEYPLFLCPFIIGIAFYFVFSSEPFVFRYLHSSHAIHLPNC